ncbi:SRPBCC family protein [Paenibacillus sp. Y412MC10]|uniref:SRPBCC family protein n=1 Tax=Geobacillus sp. (strain Y412MC10) TaxID=481743 RepID=UPI0011AB66CB|nr:SRPBCC family protein [Paenibacillus sp. Y412MC10]
MCKRSFVYVTYIAATPENLWQALTDGDLTEKYFFGTRVESEWTVGSSVNYLRGGEVTDYGKVLACDAPRQLSFTWIYKGDNTPRNSPGVVTFELQPMGSVVKLILRHENLLDSDFVDEERTFEGYNNGWPAILSNLKTFLEQARRCCRSPYNGLRTIIPSKDKTKAGVLEKRTSGFSCLMKLKMLPVHPNEFS